MDIHTAQNIRTLIFKAVLLKDPGLDQRHTAYIMTAADLRPKHDGNVLIKFADDTYMIWPAENSGTCIAELTHIDDWAERNNLRLNCAKTKEIIVWANGREARQHNFHRPAMESSEFLV